MAMRQQTVPTTETLQIAAVTPSRTAISFKNFAGGVGFISQDQTDVATLGFPLNPGDTISFIREDGDEPEVAFYSIATGSSADIRIQESFGAERKGR